MPFAGAWAQALVTAAQPEWVTGNIAEGVDRARRSFDPLANGANEVDFVLEDLWHERGSAATLIVAEVTSEAGTTRCCASTVGDCVLVVSEPRTLLSFPLSTSAEFTNRTDAVRTQQRDFPVRSWTGELPPGSMLAAASDAIGAWLLDRRERAGAGSVHAWLKTMSDAALPDVEDDVTLLVLDVPATEPDALSTPTGRLGGAFHRLRAALSRSFGDVHSARNSS